MSDSTQFPVLLNVDVIENDHRYQIVADVAGFQAKDVSVTKWQDSLVIEIVSGGHSNQVSFYLGEWEVETYRRVIPLGFDIEQDDINTSFDSDRLTVNVTKPSTRQRSEQSQPQVVAA